MSDDRGTEFARHYLDDLATRLRGVAAEPIGRVLALLERAHLERRTVFIVGNGGSAATASHMACDLIWGVAQIGLPAMRAIALTDNVPVLTAIANDRSYSEVFAHQIEAHADAGDLLVAISGSGNSPNVVRAVEAARSRGLSTVALLGRDGGKVRDMVDVAVVVPADEYGPIEDLHTMLEHLFVAYLRNRPQAPG